MCTVAIHNYLFRTHNFNIIKNTIIFTMLIYRTFLYSGFELFFSFGFVLNLFLNHDYFDIFE